MRLTPARIPSARQRLMLLALAANLMLACGDKGSDGNAVANDTGHGEGGGGADGGGGGDGSSYECRNIVLRTPEANDQGIALDVEVMVVHDGLYSDSTFFILTELGNIDSIELIEQLGSLEWVEELGEEAYVDRATPRNKLTPETIYQINWHESSEMCGRFTPWEFTTAAE